MNPTALQILRAALEEIAKGPDTFGPRWAMSHARAALEAADKAPGLADDVKLLDYCAQEIRMLDGTNSGGAAHVAEIVLRAIDTYQRGGAKP